MGFHGDGEMMYGVSLGEGWWRKSEVVHHGLGGEEAVGEVHRLLVGEIEGRLKRCLMLSRGLLKGYGRKGRGEAGFSIPGRRGWQVNYK